MIAEQRRQLSLREFTYILSAKFKRVCTGVPSIKAQWLYLLKIFHNAEPNKIWISDLRRFDELFS